MLNLWPSDNTPLGEKARQLAVDFHKKKSEYMKGWLKELENVVRGEILLEASLGETDTYFRIEKYVYDLKPFTVEVDGVSRSYALSTKDRSKLVSELKAIYSDKSNYPDLIVKIDDFGKGLLIYWR